MLQGVQAQQSIIALFSIFIQTIRKVLALGARWLLHCITYENLITKQKQTKMCIPVDWKHAT